MHHLVEHPEPVHQRRQGVAHRRHVDNQDHRRAQGGGDCGRTVDLGLSGQAVEQAHRALDDRDLRSGRAVREERSDSLRADQARVQVATRAARGQAQIGGVGVVGADLEAGGRNPPRATGGEQADRDSGLAMSRRGCAHHYARVGGHHGSLGDTENCDYVILTVGHRTLPARREPPTGAG
nr:hypothetical protein GCM10020092_092860 [Actinoplanes digitatis]